MIKKKKKVAINVIVTLLIIKKTQNKRLYVIQDKISCHIQIPAQI